MPTAGFLGRSSSLPSRPSGISASSRWSSEGTVDRSPSTGTATIHERADDCWSLEEQISGVRFPTHLGRVLKDLGIKHITAYSPQAKVRIERGFGVLEDPLVAELELQGITDIDHANTWLEEVFKRPIQQTLRKETRRQRLSLPETPSKERYLKIAFAYEATVANDNCVQLAGLIIDIPPGRG